MKIYKNYSNKKIILYAYSAVLLFIYNMYSSFNKLSSLIGIIIILIAPIFIIISNTREIYTIDDKQITRRRIGKSAIPWDNVKDIEISGWYIKITADNYVSYKILKKKNYHDLFEEMKMEIISHANDNKIRFVPSINEYTLMREGGLSALFAHYVLGSISAPLLAVMGIYMTINSTAIIDYIYNSVTILQGIVLSIFMISIWSMFLKNKIKTINKIINIEKFIVGFAIVIQIINIVSKWGSITVFSLTRNMASIAYAIFMALIIIEYVKSSERVKHYFVKE